MIDRIDTPFTNEHFAGWCLKMLGQPYWYGTCGYKATKSLLNSKKKQYPKHYTAARMARYERDIANKTIVCDCIGGAKAYAWTGGGQAILDAIGSDRSASSQYGSNGCPDKSADGMFAFAKSKGLPWGEMDTLPDAVGIALHMDGHAGYTVGGGFAVEWRGFSYGCVKTKIAARKWKHWYHLPFIHYDLDAAEVPSPDAPAQRMQLRRGSAGAQVIEMQKKLTGAGYALPSYGADGEFGAETDRALRAFQAAQGLEVDGICGPKTWAALDAAEKAGEPGRTVRVTGGTVNVRDRPNTAGNILKIAKKGEAYPATGRVADGWFEILTDRGVGWISGKYAE